MDECQETQLTRGPSPDSHIPDHDPILPSEPSLRNPATRTDKTVHGAHKPQIAVFSCFRSSRGTRRGRILRHFMIPGCTCRSDEVPTLGGAGEEGSNTCGERGLGSGSCKSESCRTNRNRRSLVSGSRSTCISNPNNFCMTAWVLSSSRSYRFNKAWEQGLDTEFRLVRTSNERPDLGPRSLITASAG
jgi:hypothetical protein